ncbi:MAG: PTS sugar transporter subunit IIA [Chloroflexota bacterium]
MTILTIENISLGASASDKSDAIKQAGQLLANSNCIKPEYIDGMLAREETMSTYLGNGVAIPHGTHDSIKYIQKSGISVLQVPEGVEWEEDEIAYLIIGIASSSDDHIEILSNLADVIEDEDEAMKMAKTSDPQLILDALSKQPQAE